MRSPWWIGTNECEHPGCRTPAQPYLLLQELTLRLCTPHVRFWETHEGMRQIRRDLELLETEAAASQEAIVVAARQIDPAPDVVIDGPVEHGVTMKWLLHWHRSVLERKEACCREAFDLVRAVYHDVTATVATPARLRELADELDARAQAHECAGFDCATCGVSQVAGQLRELADGATLG